MFLRIQFIKIDAVGLSSDGMVTTQKTIFSFPNVLKIRSFQKITLEYDLSCIIWKNDIFFTRKHIFFSFDGK